MSAERMPSRSEVMGWNPQRLADYLKRMSLSGCDKVVLKNSISGARFVNLSENDLQKFPKLHAPMISKISAEISKKEERRHFFGIFPSKNQEADAVTEVQGWGEEEFDDEEFDDDYESPFSGDEEGSGGDYESPNDDQDAANDYEPPPSEPPENPKLCPTLPIGNSVYIDNRNNHVSKDTPPVLCPRPPVSTRLLQPGDPSSSRRDHSPHAAGRAAGKHPAEPPQIFREDKPGRGAHPNTAGGSVGTHPRRPQPDVPDHPNWSKPPVLPPTSEDRRNSSVRPPPNKFDSRREQTRDEAPKHNTFPLHNKNQPPRPGLPGPPSRHGDSLPPNVPSGGSLPQKLHSALAEQRDRQPFRPPPSIQELDPSWYVGNVTRGQAEGCLKRVRKDGAYLVRDSTRQLTNQPFTLMVFYQDKVYNIQIRQQNQQFLLGTGLKVHESFPSVSDIISHYSQSPLLLIDAKNRGSSQQNQCLLSDPAGYYMGRPNWT